jgi:hypothetical protein
VGCIKLKRWNWKKRVRGAADGVSGSAWGQKQQIVEATLVPGASLALVARERGVNAN